jgi:hypothetical protein
MTSLEGWGFTTKLHPRGVLRLAAGRSYVKSENPGEESGALGFAICDPFSFVQDRFTIY